MFKNLKMLLSIRAWLKSRTMNVAGILGIIAAMDVTAGTGIVQMAIDFLVNHLGLMQSTAVAWLVGVKALADALLRTKTDKALDQK